VIRGLFSPTFLVTGHRVSSDPELFLEVAVGLVLTMTSGGMNPLGLVMLASPIYYAIWG